jgi:AraC-like DNA-binding protein
MTDKFNRSIDYAVHKTGQETDQNVYYKPRRYFEIDTQFIPAHQWPLSLIELALSRGLEEHKLLRGTGIFREDIDSRKLRLSPQHCFQLINNMQKHIQSNELSFLLGHRFFSAQDNAVTTAMNNAANLQLAIDIFIDHQLQMMPLLNLRRSYEQDRLVIYWQDACGAETSMIFLLEMMFTALSSLACWHSGENLPWQFYFTHNKPAYIEQYEVHLHTKVQFSSHANAMVIARDYLYSPWKNHNASAFSNAIETADQFKQTIAFQGGFLSEIYNYLHQNIQHNPNLEQTAEAFGMSSASLKRKLKKHQSHFQEQYDLVRKDLALYWLNQAGWSKEQVARKLHFYDVANLRRAFKRWTKSLPVTIEKTS